MNIPIKQIYLVASTIVLSGTAEVIKQQIEKKQREELVKQIGAQIGKEIKANLNIH